MVLVRLVSLVAVPTVVLVGLACRIVPGRDVRYEPTPMPVVHTMLQMAAVGPQDVVFDLGSGDGRIPITAAKEYGARAVGIEIDPALVARSQAAAQEAGVADRVEFRLGDMYAADLRQATVVTLFLHPQPNLKLRSNLQQQLPPGGRVVSYMWDMGDWAPETFRRAGRHKVFLWRLRGTISASWDRPSSRRCGTRMPCASSRTDRHSCSSDCT